MVSYKALNTTTESCRTNICDGVGNGHSGQAFATLKSRTTDFCNGVADAHRGQTNAVLVFANAFISVTYVLNGRKVTAKLLKRLEKMKI